MCIYGKLRRLRPVVTRRVSTHANYVYFAAKASPWTQILGCDCRGHRASMSRCRCKPIGRPASDGRHGASYVVPQPRFTLDEQQRIRTLTSTRLVRMRLCHHQRTQIVERRSQLLNAPRCGPSSLAACGDEAQKETEIGPVPESWELLYQSVSLHISCNMDSQCAAMSLLAATRYCE